MDRDRSLTTEVLRSKGMDAPFKKNAKYADLYSIPETWVGEIIHGDLYAFPRARTVHKRALTRIIQALVPADDDDAPDGWVILHDVEIWFGKNLLVPDLSGWRRSRLPEIPDIVTMKLAPDWVCEGISPSTARLDKGPKREIYAKGGVGHLWFADPATRSIDVFALERKSYRFVQSAGGDEKLALAPFPHAIELARLWKR
jgi:Uma2 family endonuclease